MKKGTPDKREIKTQGRCAVCASFFPHYDAMRGWCQQWNKSVGYLDTCLFYTETKRGTVLRDGDKNNAR